ncbi:MAG: UbiX family flavin prenyltransferase [Phycisphaerae bacterium]|nr:UbiX family flavin prenyltransferase [Phycisphaerae bacterium]
MTIPTFNPHETSLDPSPRRFVLGISGASGAWYSIRLLELLLGMGHEVHLVVSDYGRRLLFDEADVRVLDFENLLPHVVKRLGHDASHAAERRAMESRLIIHPNKDVGAVIASGSFMHDGMVVLPCSSASLGQLAAGSGSNLLCRAAMVTLKERRTLIVCHREMPLSLIDIRNMEQLSLAGAVLCSPNPGFYLGPRSVGDIIDFVVGKVLDLLKVPHALKTRWEDHVSGELEVEG